MMNVMADLVIDTEYFNDPQNDSHSIIFFRMLITYINGILLCSASYHMSALICISTSLAKLPDFLEHCNVLLGEGFSVLVCFCQFHNCYLLPVFCTYYKSSVLLSIITKKPVRIIHKLKAYTAA